MITQPKQILQPHELKLNLRFILCEYWSGSERFITKYPRYFNLASLKNTARENTVRKTRFQREVQFKFYDA